MHDHYVFIIYVTMDQLHLYPKYISSIAYIPVKSKFCGVPLKVNLLNLSYGLQKYFSLTNYFNVITRC